MAVVVVVVVAVNVAVVVVVAVNVVVVVAVNVAVVVAVNVVANAWQSRAIDAILTPTLMPLDVIGNVTQDVVASLEPVIDGQQTLEDVVRWALAQTPPRIVEDVVVQDEYTHDVVLPYRDGIYLVYDTT